jgi:outer membrane protein assembly factor BamB
MKIATKTSVLLILLICSQHLLLAQKEWNQFRGPARSGISNNNINQVTWDGNNLEQVWKKQIGSAFSELVFDNGLIYTMISDTIDSKTGSEYVAAFKEDSGEFLWKSRVDSIYFDEDNWGDGSRATPTYDDNAIYSFSGHGKLSATDKKDGKLLWQVDFKKEFGSTTPRWGFASSPLLYDDQVIMEVGGTENRAFAGFEKATGKLIWSYGTGNASHDSPLLANIGGQDQVIFANGYTLYSFTPEGDTIWTYKMPMGMLTAMPVLIDENKLFLSGVRNPAYFIVEINDNKPNQIMKGNTMKNDFSSSLYCDDHIYGFNVAMLRCISTDSSDAKWTKRGYGKGALIMADKILIILSDKGKLTLAEATPESFKELASIQALEGKSWTAPTINNGRIYVRNLTEMACYKIK